MPDTPPNSRREPVLEGERSRSGAAPRPGDAARNDRADAGPMITRVQLDETLAQVSDVVLTVATDGTIGYVSPGIRSLLGFDQDDDRSART